MALCARLAKPKHVRPALDAWEIIESNDDLANGTKGPFAIHSESQMQYNPADETTNWVVDNNCAGIVYSAFGKEANRVRKILITSIERHKGSSDGPYRVEGKTSGSEPTLFYKLACNSGAADLEVGHLYDAEEETEEGYVDALHDVWGVMHRLQEGDERS